MGDDVTLVQCPLKYRVSYCGGLVSLMERSTDIRSLTNSLKEACFHPCCTNDLSSGLALVPLPPSPGAFGLRTIVVMSRLCT